VFLRSGHIVVGGARGEGGGSSWFDVIKGPFTSVTWSRRRRKGGAGWPGAKKTVCSLRGERHSCDRPRKKKRAHDP